MLSSSIGALMELAEKEQHILYLTSDSGEGGLDTIFRKNFPDRSFDFGIAEGNMIGAAAGLASAGKIPFVYAPTPFLVYRALEFLRNDVCLQNYPVKFIGTGSGLSVSSLGPTHHSTEDLGSLRSLPNLTILSPATPRQAWLCVEKAYELAGPVFVRIAMTQSFELFSDGYTLPQSGLDFLRDGKDALILTTGGILEEVLTVSDLLQPAGIELAIANLVQIKPINTEALVEILEKVRFVFTVEEHNVIGGIGSLVAEIIATYHLDVKLVRIGLNDQFSVGYGTLPQIRKENGLDVESIMRLLRKDIK